MREAGVLVRVELGVDDGVSEDALYWEPEDENRVVE